MALHGSFTLERTLAASPARVFAGFARAELRSRWAKLPGPTATATHELDFRVGGSESAGNTFVAGDLTQRLEYRGSFLDIVPDERVVFTYEAVVDDRPRWISLVTVELRPRTAASAESERDGPDGGGREVPTRTDLRWTEQYVFLVLTGDGADDVAHLRGGTLLRLNGLEAALGAAPRADTT
ncbi:conserved hypothetical protein [Frankia canadensis]|uniref:Activator of Hsp90 ATPase homologue 1/2-like C-terminal domain-containing protein n=1 Tax=Frankia canadensis TaxID=1836972 RepID=A0A2I2KQ59_9ACTN|nr:SRPBCC domain-containing protein [Frankia canadensis]SNQ47808.1 conserved hypothetical protein [Frankia canadensis]SOU55098.1 conserved hypothetical protein [Frankia canadensis]